MMLKLLLNIRMIQMIFLYILMNTDQIKNRKVLMVVDDIIADMLCNKKPQLTVTESFIRNFCLLLSHKFILQHQNILDYTLHTTLLGKFQIKENFKKSQIIINQTLLKMYCEAILFLVALDNPLRFNSNLFERI